MATQFITAKRASSWLAKNRDSIKRLVDLRRIAKEEQDRVETYTKPLLEKYDFKAATLGLSVTSVSNLYLVENDEERIESFFEELADLHASNGWTGERGHCPALVAGNAAIDCELKLLPEIASLLGVTTEALRNSITPCKQAIDLVIRLYEEVF